MTLWLAVMLILCGWFLCRQGTKLEAAHRVPESPPDDDGTPDSEIEGYPTLPGSSRSARLSPANVKPGLS